MAGALDGDPISMLLGLFPAFAVGWSVYKKSKTVASYAQLGGLQGREQAEIQLLAESKSRDSSTGPQPIKMQDKTSFSLSVAGICATVYLLGAAPAQFYLWYTPVAAALCALRWYTFKKQLQHNLLYDFCYWVNGLAIVYLWIMFPSSTVFQILFVVANGPLAWSMLAYSQAPSQPRPAHRVALARTVNASSARCNGMYPFDL